MKSTGNQQINSRVYWNLEYSDPQVRRLYEKQGPETQRDGILSVPPTMRFYKALDEVKEGDKVLDIGCGVGQFTNLVFIHKPGCDIYGTDISDRVITDNHLRNPNIHYSCQVVGKIDLPENSFDVIFSGEVLEHLDEPKTLLEDAYRLLKPRGKFILTTPKENAIESDEHMWYFTHDDVEELYRNAGFKRVKFIYLPDLEYLTVIMAVGYK